MARERRVWSTNRDHIRRRLNDEDATTPHWSDADLLSFYNDCKDELELHFDFLNEGWNVFRYNDNLVAGQQEYALPEETGRLLRIFRVESGGERKQVVHQDRQFDGTYSGDDTQSGTVHFTYSLKDNHVFLYPCPSESITAGLQYELEIATDRIVNDSDKLPDSWHPFAETLLNIDTAIAALETEATSDGEDGDSSQIRLLRRRRERLAGRLEDVVFNRTNSYVVSPGWNQGA